jgi:hypothetical protein
MKYLGILMLLVLCFACTRNKKELKAVDLEKNIQSLASKNWPKDSLYIKEQTPQINAQLASLGNDSLMLEWLQVREKVEPTEIKRLEYLKKANELARKNSNLKAQAAINEKLAYMFYQTNSEKAVEHLLIAAGAYKKIKNNRRRALCLQNISFAYDEKLNNKSKALYYAKQSVKIHAQNKDTLGEANMLKYVGVLMADANEFEKGKKYILEAIEKFKSKQHIKGIAVSYGNLARLYSSWNKNDVALSYLLKSRDIWQKENVPSRLFDLNNLEMNICYKKDWCSKNEKLIVINEEILKSNNIFWSQELDFYRNAKKYYAKHKDNKMVQLYSDRIKSKEEELRNQGIVVPELN